MYTTAFIQISNPTFVHCFSFVDIYTMCFLCKYHSFCVIMLLAFNQDMHRRT